MTEGNRLFTLITGASSGIGRETAVRLSSRRRLILSGRDLGRLEETRTRCEDREEHLVWPFDLSNVGPLAYELTDLLVTKGVRVESFIHCAGLLSVLPIRNVDHNTINPVLNVNFISAAEIMSVLVKKKVNHEQLRSVVLISSIISTFGAPGFSIYSASKGAVDALMRSLAVELAPAVRVNSIAAGGIRTRMTEALLANSDVEDKLTKDYPLGLGEAKDIVDATEFLISDNARWITGQRVVVDGGRSVNISV